MDVWIYWSIYWEDRAHSWNACLEICLQMTSGLLCAVQTLQVQCVSEADHCRAAVSSGMINLLSVPLAPMASLSKWHALSSPAWLLAVMVPVSKSPCVWWQCGSEEIRTAWFHMEAKITEEALPCLQKRTLAAPQTPSLWKIQPQVASTYHTPHTYTQSISIE